MDVEGHRQIADVEWDGASKRKKERTNEHENKNENVYIYIYMCVCVSVCARAFFPLSFYIFLSLSPTHNPITHIRAQCDTTA